MDSMGPGLSPILEAVAMSARMAAQPVAILVVLASRDVAMAPAARQSANQFGAIVET